MADWAEIGKSMADARRGQAPAEQAAFDQALAGVEKVARQHGVDLTDPAQARAAVLGASTVLNQAKSLPLWPLFGAPWFEQPLTIPVAVFASFIGEDGR